jgi:hypothetical protein
MEIFFKSRQEGLNWDECVQNLYEGMLKYMEDNMEVISYLSQVMVAALNFYRDRIENWKIISVEEEYRLDLPDFTYVWKPDLLVVENGSTVLIDYKYVYDMYDDEMTQLMPQIPRYLGAHRASGLYVTKGYYFFLRHRNIKAEGENNRYRLVPISPSAERIKTSFRELVHSATGIAAKKSLSIVEWRDSTRRVGNQMVCKSCSFKDLCVAELNGSDGKILRMTEYEPSTYGYAQEKLE